MSTQSPDLVQDKQANALNDSDAIIVPVHLIKIPIIIPRIELETESFHELVNSIKNHGILEPVLVQQDPEKNTFSLLSGYRRIKAAIVANLKTIPARLIAFHSEEEKLVVQLTENIQRQDLHPIEIARLLNHFFTLNKKDKEIASLVSKSLAWISKYKKISKMPQKILQDPYAFHASLNDLLSLESHFLKHEDLLKAWELYKTLGLKAALQQTLGTTEAAKLKPQDIALPKAETTPGITREFMIVTKNQSVFNCRMQFSESKSNDIQVILPQQYSAEEMKDIFEKIIQSIHHA